MKTREDIRAHLKTLPIPLKPYSEVDLDHDCVDMKGSGWMFDVMYKTESILWGRWAYWVYAWADMKPPQDPIPQIEFEESPHPSVLKMLDHTLECALQGKVHRYRAMEWLVDWIRWSLGGLADKPENPIDDLPCDVIAYQVFNLDPMLLYPYDYFGHWYAEAGHGKNGAAFYPTPMGVTSLMEQMVFQGEVNPHAKTMDPAVGTGRTLLAASNKSLRLYGQDIDARVLACLEVNFALYAPWGFRPLPDSVWEPQEATDDEEE